MKIRAAPQEQVLKETSSFLCVDLDGTLVRTDTLIESLLAYVRVQPLRLFRVVLWLFLGKARFKEQLGRVISLQPDSLPYARDVLDYIESESRAGRKLVLVTAADSSIAFPVAEHLGLFTQVICSEGRENVSGKAKLAAIQRALGDDFGYVGNSRSDLAVWSGAKSAVVVGASGRVLKAVTRSGVTIERVFPRQRFSIRIIAKAMRVHQWTKNSLVLLPILLGHHIFQRITIVNGIRAFFAFSFVASAIYLINDLMDLTTDRKHPRKKYRPMAAGDLSIPAGIFLTLFLLVGGALVNPAPEAALFLALYAVTAMGYSLYLKRLLMIDVIMLAGFYTLRLLYGGAAVRIEVSVWTLAFSMFMFLSLALIKRISELRVHSSEEGLSGSGRGYQKEDVRPLTALCAASGLVSSLILILYVRSPEVAPLYSRPQVLLGIFPLLAYWQSRLLILANRGAITGDPVVFSIFDRASQAVAAALLAIIAVAI
jgi:4-hydroxybenzoate polyprenyltransferase/phosphoserine phosphatase